jgi:hypothetical protein
MKVDIYVRKEGIGSFTLLGKLTTELMDMGLNIGRVFSEPEKELTIHYDTSSYARYANGITAEQLRDDDIEWLKKRGWEIKEIDK